ncbi:MAG: nucleotidyltransferase family protein [Pseudomonadota bacterium]
MSAPRVAMALAAGFGTRMGALTRDRPKPLIEVAGRALIDHALDDAAAAGVERAVVNLHYLGEMIAEHLADRERPEIAFSPEEALLDTGGGVLRALPLLGPDPFFCLNADAIWTGARPLPALAAAWDPARMGAVLHLVRRDDARGHAGSGDFFADDDGRLVRRGGAAAAPFVFTGAQILTPAAFEGAPGGAFSTNLIWDRLIDERRLFGVVHEGAWIDVGSPAGLALAEEALA